MALRDWLAARSVGVATATPATPATPPPRGLETVATVATVAVADSQIRLGPVVRLRLLLEEEDGRRFVGILAIPRERYDGLRVLELFERHRLAGSTRVVEIRESEAAP